MRYVLPIVLSLVGFVAGYLLTPASAPSPKAALAHAAEEAEAAAPAFVDDRTEPGSCPMGLDPADCCGSTTCQVTATADGGCPLGLDGCGPAEQAAGSAVDDATAAPTCAASAPGCGGDQTACAQSGCAAAAADQLGRPAAVDEP